MPDSVNVCGGGLQNQSLGRDTSVIRGGADRCSVCGISEQYLEGVCRTIFIENDGDDKDGDDNDGGDTITVFLDTYPSDVVYTCNFLNEKMLASVCLNIFEERQLRLRTLYQCNFSYKRDVQVVVSFAVLDPKIHVKGGSKQRRWGRSQFLFFVRLAIICGIVVFTGFVFLIGNHYVQIVFLY